MPTYTYKCESCEHQFDAFQRMSDPKLTDCPECEKVSLVKIITSTAAPVLKGKDWTGQRLTK